MLCTKISLISLPGAALVAFSLVDELSNISAPVGGAAGGASGPAASPAAAPPAAALPVAAAVADTLAASSDARVEAGGGGGASPGLGCLCGSHVQHECGMRGAGRKK